MNVDPVRDMEIICEELVFKDLEYAEKRMEELVARLKRNNDKEAAAEKEVLDKVLELLRNNKWIRTTEWNFKEIEALNKHCFITAKNVVYLINLSEKDFINKKNKWLGKIKEWIDKNCPGDIIPYSADYERKLVEEELN